MAIPDDNTPALDDTTSSLRMGEYVIIWDGRVIIWDGHVII